MDNPPGPAAGSYAPAVARFLTLDDVANELAISKSQVYALVRNGTLAAMKVGGRGQWRVERPRLEEYIAAAHEQTARFVAEHPFTGQDDDGSED